MPTIGACTDAGSGEPWLSGPPKLLKCPLAATVRYKTRSGPMYGKGGAFTPVPNGLVPRTFTMPLPLGTITTADFALADTTLALVAPNLIVPRSRPTPRSVTRAPALPWFGVIERTCGHASPDAIG